MKALKKFIEIKCRHWYSCCFLGKPRPAWKEGMVKGLKARGAFEVSIQWKDHLLIKASITSFNGGKCVIPTAMPVMVKGMTVKSVKDRYEYLLSFNTV